MFGRSIMLIGFILTFISQLLISNIQYFRIAQLLIFRNLLHHLSTKKEKLIQKCIIKPTYWNENKSSLMQIDL
ncbi:hypothetical protein V1478_005578 [Vespula squamosa]|uniref:ATP synthase F0 subunit 8 n=1 Tax=Vespula squamosa TaxID=30214 RepID=A0ABD2BB19_VESSQ